MTDTHPAVAEIIRETEELVESTVGRPDKDAVIEILAETCWRYQRALERGGFVRKFTGPPGGERQDHDPHGVNR